MSDALSLPGSNESANVAVSMSANMFLNETVQRLFASDIDH